MKLVGLTRTVFDRTPAGKTRRKKLVTSIPSSPKPSVLIKTVGWLSAGLGAVALGFVVGNEIRERYKFNRRTPYDNYGHSGDQMKDTDCSLGI